MEGQTAKAAEKIAKKTREEKLREQKIESEILKSLNAISEPDQKFQTLLHRCVEAERISRSATLQQKQNQKTIETLLLEKDHLAAEHQRILSTKAKLESLCRELQSQNKTIKEDSLSKIREEEERRKETQNKFQHSLNEIQKLMNENSEKNQKLERDNQEMSGKFKHILSQYEEREKQMDRINRQMELVTQLNEAKLAKSNIETLAQKEAFLKQTAILEDTVIILKRQLTEAVGSEKAYKAQVDLYSSKYGEFTKTFEGYKKDMTKMSKNTFKMEKEMLQWKIKYEKSNSMLLDLISEKQIRDEHIGKTAKQLFYLQKLCRTLSSEKKAYYGKLVESNIEIPAITEIVTEEVIPVVPEVVKSKGADKLDEMVKSQNELKKNLTQLQSQLTAMQNEEDQAASKKTKSKKNKKGAKQNGAEAQPESTEVTIEGSSVTEVESCPESIIVESVEKPEQTIVTPAPIIETTGLINEVAVSPNSTLNGVHAMEPTSNGVQALDSSVSGTQPSANGVVEPSVNGTKQPDAPASPAKKAPASPSKKSKASPAKKAATPEAAPSVV